MIELTKFLVKRLFKIEFDIKVKSEIANKVSQSIRAISDTKKMVTEVDNYVEAI